MAAGLYETCRVSAGLDALDRIPLPSVLHWIPWQNMGFNGFLWEFLDIHPKGFLDHADVPVKFERWASPCEMHCGKPQDDVLYLRFIAGARYSLKLFTPPRARPRPANRREFPPARSVMSRADGL